MDLIQKTIIGIGVVGISFVGYYTHTQGDCKGLSDAYCSYADTLYAKHGTKAVYGAVREYKLKGARPSGETNNLLNDYSIKDAVELAKMLGGLV